MTAVLRLKSQAQYSNKPADNRFGVDFDLNGESNFSQKSEPRKFDKMPLQKETLTILTKTKDSDMLEQFYKQKGEISSEEYMSNLFNSLNCREGYNAWGQFSESEREIFVDNFLLIMQECLAVQMRFSTNFCVKVLFKMSCSTGSFELSLNLLNELFRIIRSPNIRMNIVHSYLASAINVKGSLKNKFFQDGGSICENTLADIFSDKRLRIDARSVVSHSSALSAYLDFAVKSQTFDNTKCQFLVDHFLNLSVNEMPPVSLVLGYSSLMNLQLIRKIRVVIDNTNNVEFMNYALKKYIFIDRSEERGEEEEQSVKGDGEYQVVSREEIPNQVLCQFIQACFIENDETWKNKTGLLSMFGEKMERRYPEDVFKKWVYKLYISNTEEMEPRKMAQVCKIFNIFLTPRTSHKLKLKFMKTYSEQIKKINDPNIACLVLNLLVCFKTMLNDKLQKDSVKFDFEKDLSESDKTLINELYNFLIEKVLANSNTLYFQQALDLLTMILGTFGKMTVTEIKLQDLHKQTWDKVNSREQLRFVNSSVLNAISQYDLEKDREMQDILVRHLNKLTEENEKAIRKRKISLPKSFYGILEMLAEKKDTLDEHAIVLLNKLEEIKNLKESN